jgi:hypothetical protein
MTVARRRGTTSCLGHAIENGDWLLDAIAPIGVFGKL